MGRRRQRTKADGIDLVRVRAFIAEGLTDAQIALEMRVAMTDVVTARRDIITQGLLEVGPLRPIGEVYTEHRLAMVHVQDQLDDLALDTWDEKPHISLGALKAKAKIADQILERGQELGVLPRAARKASTQMAVAVGVQIGGMTDPELVGHLGHLNREGDRLRNEYGDKSFLDLDPPEVYPIPDVVDVEPEPVRVKRRKA